MTGEHWDSATGKSLDKKKDQYVRIQWVVPKEKTLTTIITRKQLSRDPSLEQALLHWKELAQKVPEGTCILKKEKIGVKDPYIHIEFYNWEEPKTETSYDVCLRCIRNTATKMKLDSLKTLGKNPTFNPTITCASTNICDSYEPSDSKDLNCTHIALKFESVLTRDEKGGKMDLAPKLYCKRAHPNEVILPSEQDLDWNVAFGGSAIMLQNMSEKMKQFRERIEKNPKLRERVRRDLKKGVKQYAKSIAENLGITLD